MTVEPNTSGSFSLVIVIDVKFINNFLKMIF